MRGMVGPLCRCTKIFRMARFRLLLLECSVDMLNAGLSIGRAWALSEYFLAFQRREHEFGLSQACLKLTTSTRLFRAFMLFRSLANSHLWRTVLLMRHQTWSEMVGASNKHENSWFCQIQSTPNPWKLREEMSADVPCMLEVRLERSAICLSSRWRRWGASWLRNYASQWVKWFRISKRKQRSTYSTIVTSLV